MNSTERSFLSALWDFFCSLRLTISLLIGLAVVSIIGTVIPQVPNIPPEYIHSLSQAKLQLYDKLGFFSMYNSWWYVLLLYLLTINLIACSIKRLPHIWKIIFLPTLIMSEQLEKTLSTATTIRFSGSSDSIRGRVATFLQNEFAMPVQTQEDGTWHLFAQKNPWCRLAVYIVHLSVIVIFIGAIIGTMFGFKGNVEIVEGAAVDSVMTRADKQYNLGFSVRCDSFSVAYYPTGAPKEFKSILTVLEHGRPVPGYDRIPVIVNDPLSYKGITFYQSSYGKKGSHEFVVSDPDGKNPQSLFIQSNGSAKLPDGSGICMQDSVKDVSPFQPGLSGAAAQVELHTPDGATKSVVVYANHPEMNRQNIQTTGGKLLSYKGGDEQVYTGLQVAKDPGVWIVWLGCLLMIIGIYVAFFMTHRRIWIRIDNDTLTIGGNSSKNHAAFQHTLERLVEKLNSNLVTEEKK